MAFVANARPEQSDTHSCSLNKGIGWESRTRKESVAGLQSIHLRLQARGRIPKVAVILKYCFPCGKSPRAVKTGHLKSCHGSARRLKQCACAEELSAHEWISQKTYKPPKRKKPVRDTHGTFQHLNSPAYAQPEFPTQRRWLLQSSFFYCLRMRQKLDFLRILRKSPTCEAICVSENLFLVHRKMESWTFDDISEKVQEMRTFWHAFVGQFATRL